MKKLLLSILFVGVATLANAQKSEIAEAKRLWGIFQFSMSQDPDAPKRPMQRPQGGPPGPASENLVNGKLDSKVGKTKAPTGGGDRSSGNTAAPAKTSFLERQIASLNAGMSHADKAIANEKTKEVAEAWVYKALFSSSIALVDTLNIQNASTNQKAAEEAIVKAKALDTKGDEKDNILIAETNILNSIRVRGKNAFDKKDFATAYKSFLELIGKNPQDTSMYVNLGVTAKELKNYPDAIVHFKKAISLNSPESKILYYDVINMTLVNVKDTVAGLALTQEAIKKYPDDVDLIGIQTDLYITKGDIAKSQESLTQLIAKNPKNPLYQYLMGDTYYKQALGIQKQRAALDTKKVKEFDALTAKMTLLINQAIPFYEKSLEINPVFVPALEVLKQVYGFKGDTAKFNDAKKRLDAIPAAN
jgi:tetratricopeptide (TPR) repeat protein